MIGSKPDHLLRFIAHLLLTLLFMGIANNILWLSVDATYRWIYWVVTGLGALAYIVFLLLLKLIAPKFWLVKNSQK